MMPSLQQKVQSVLDELVDTGAETGLQIAVYHHGALVVDAVAGIADGQTGRSATHDKVDVGSRAGAAISRQDPRRRPEGLTAAVAADNEQLRLALVEQMVQLPTGRREPSASMRFLRRPRRVESGGGMPVRGSPDWIVKKSNVAVHSSLAGSYREPAASSAAEMGSRSVMSWSSCAAPGSRTLVRRGRQ